MDITHFQHIFDFLPGNYIILAPDAPKFTILAYNRSRANETFTGPEDIGKGIFEAFPDNPDDVTANGVAMLSASLHTVLRDKVPHEMAIQQYDIPNRANTAFEIRYWLPKNIPVTGETGEVDYIIHYVTDVTEQVSLRKKEKLNELNQQAFDLFMQAPVGICILKGDEHVVELANYPLLEIWGKTSSIIGKTLLEALPEIREQGFVELLNGVKNSGEPYYANEHEATLIRKGKTETVYLNFVYQPYYEVDQRISGVIAIATEVTEQVVSRKKIELAEETARLAMESASLGNYEISLETDEMFTSPRFNAIWGLGGTVKRSAFAEAIHPEDRSMRLQAHEESLRTGKLVYETRVIWPDGSIHWVKINGSVLFDEHKKPVRLLGVIQDITDTKAFTDEMKRLVSEKTKDLQTLNADLERSNRELEQFAYVTSHDLQEPLRKIQIYGGMLARTEDLPPQSLGYIEKIDSSAQRMTGLIRELLEYARLSKTNDQFRKVDLNEIMLQVLADFELLIGQKDADVQFSELATIQAIPLQINQLFYNLIGNALKFAKKEGPVKIDIQGEKISSQDIKQYPTLDPSKTYYQVTFTDNGIGFDQAYAEKIFSIFQRLNQRTEYGGYGIGLALCNRVALNHKGLIFAKGSPGEGAAFTVILPIVA